MLYPIRTTAVATINKTSRIYTTECPEYMAVLCAAAEGRALIKNKVQKRLLRPSGIPVSVLANSTPVTFRVKFHYCHLPPLLSLGYSQIPLLSNSTLPSKLCSTFKFRHLQIPRELVYSQILVLAISVTCRLVQPS